MEPLSPTALQGPARWRPAAAAQADAVLGVVIVNYRGAMDTLECLESLLRCPQPMRVVVVENGSGDGSADQIADWAAGRLPVVAGEAGMAILSTPPLAKPIDLARIAAADVGKETGNKAAPAAALTLIESPDNLGFAGGNNLGLRHLLADPAIEHFWLLNNDTVVTRDAPGAVLARMLSGERIGMAGTIVRHYFAPDRVQALNGYSFSLLTGAARALGGNGPAAQPFNPQTIADATDFVLGASLAVSRDFLMTVGPMAEDYFLYFEEIDWATRNRRLGRDGFEIGFAHGATVFHKAGRAIGSTSVRAGRSAFSDYWLTRSRLRYIARHHPWLWPWHWLLGWAIIARRLARRHWGHAGAILRALFGRGP
ncbi:glycosyltransferase family 2 protein [Sandarakinorhabdus rubra]|uniref:glycosyltransferase family 2 protein n=1 Tax=Sandarakinorhabdus rubra TaxID=2672568 RepID=UPI0013DB6BCE|nr:glycosyltransferase family 2 protein [Sandarakinorhabdus rubra]